MFKWCKNKSQLNLVIDGLLFILIMGITGIGLLIKYILLPGRVAHEVYGGRIELFFLGLDRHDWGLIHLWVGIIFVLLLGVHIYLHWKMIGCIFRIMFTRSIVRWVNVALVGVVPLLFLVIPFFITPEVRALTPGYFHNRNIQQELHQDVSPVIKSDRLRDARPVEKEERGSRKGRGRGRRGRY